MASNKAYRRQAKLGGHPAKSIFQNQPKQFCKMMETEKAVERQTGPSHNALGCEDAIVNFEDTGNGALIPRDILRTSVP